MKRVDNIEHLRALALRQGAEVVGPGGARFNSTRARVTKPAPRPAAAAPAPDVSAAIAQMAAAITEAIRAAHKPPPSLPPVLPPAPRPVAVEVAPVAVAPTPAPLPPPVLAGELKLQTNAAGAISGCRMDLPGGRSLTMKVQHKHGLVDSATVTVDGRAMKFTVHRHPLSHRAEKMSFTGEA